MTKNSQAIAELNDKFRRTFSGGKVVLTLGISCLPEPLRLQILQAVRDFVDFDEGDDPYGEHDFGAFEYEGRSIFWKIDYYNTDLTAGAENPAAAATTTRVLTVMLADEY
jgi:hypothetical protein